MQSRHSRSVPITEIGQVVPGSRKRFALVLAVPAASLLLPGAAVELANAGGAGELTRIAAAVSQFLLFYSGVFALIALTAAVAAGLLATDRIVMSPHARIVAQAVHRTASLIGIAALANHVMLEILASRAHPADGFVPFLSARSTLFMGLGTLSSDLFVVIIITGVLRRRFTASGRPRLWRGLHLAAYAAWPMAVLHGLLAGRSARPYVDWSYGICLAAVAVALTVRYLAAHRGPSVAPGLQPPTSAQPWSPPSRVRAEDWRSWQGAHEPLSWPRANEPSSGPLRALPSPDDPRGDPWRGPACVPWHEEHHEDSGDLRPAPEPGWDRW